MWQRFENRTEAGKLLANKLGEFAARDDVVVFGLPRGGMPVAYEVAKALKAPLDVFAVRKLGVPGHEELAFGAIASGGITVVDDHLIRSLRITDEMVEETVKRETAELERRERLYRGQRALTDIRDKTIVVVDDGLATGSTMRAAIRALRAMCPKQIVVAVPVCSASTCADIGRDADVMCVCVVAPEPFYAVGIWYRNFDQTSDQEVQELLARADVGALSARRYA